MKKSALILFYNSCILLEVLFKDPKQIIKEFKLLIKIPFSYPPSSLCALSFSVFFPLVRENEGDEEEV
jgi:hypothetical protein